MNENDRESRWVSGDGPINRRTVNRQQLGAVRPQASVSPEAFARAERSQARSALGAGLAQQLESAQAPVHQAPHALQIICAIVFTCGVLMGLLAWLQMSLVLGAVSLGLVVLGALGCGGVPWARGSCPPV
jgi:VIT1/CCC1 family predicted Fe2+/Mn2+ transporter